MVLGFLKNFRIKETSYFGLFEKFQKTKAFHEMIAASTRSKGDGRWFMIGPLTQF